MLALLLASGVDSRPHRGYDPQLHLEAIKQSILTKLGMERPPDVRKALDQDELQKAHQLYQETLTRLGVTQTTAVIPGTTVHLLRPACKWNNDYRFLVTLSLVVFWLHVLRYFSFLDAGCSSPCGD